MKESLRYHMRINQTEVLGPGKRAVFWVQGCRHGKCEGCIGGAYHNQSGGTETTAGEMAQWLVNTGAEGITVSGGEPFEQASAVAETIGLVREHRPAELIVYTGFLYEELQEMAKYDEGVARLLKAAQVIIDGPYVKELDDGRPYIGSSNQRVIVLDESCRERMEEYYRPDGGRKIEMFMSASGSVLVGVPSKEQAQLWRNMEKQARRPDGKD